MKEAQDKPEQFGVAIRSGTLHVSRHFEFASGVVNLNLNFKLPGDPTLAEIHQASLSIAIGELQKLLEASKKATEKK